MGRYKFHEVGDFHVVTHAIKKSESCWGAFVFLDRRADARESIAPAVRLHISRDFNAEWAALAFAKNHAAQSIARGEIDL